MPRRNLWILLLSVLGCLLLTVTSKPRRVRFETLEAFRKFAVKHGLFFHSGGPDPNAYLDNFYVADHPVPLERLPITKFDCGLTPAWRGVVWVVPRTRDGVEVYPDFLGGTWRVWANLLVAGDERLMDRLERLYLEDGP